MYITIKRSKLIEKLDFVRKGISNKTTLPVLTGIKFDVTNEKITMIGSNSDIVIKTDLFLDNQQDAVVHNPGSVVIPGKYFVDIVKKLDGDSVELKVHDGSFINISSGKSVFNLNGFASEDYPNVLLDINDDHKLLEIDGTKLKKLIDQTAFAVSTSENRLILTGVNLQTADNKISFSATDSFRLAKQTIATQSDAQVSITLPGKNLKDLASMIKDGDNVIIYHLNNYTIFKINDVVIQSRQLEGRYPETSKIIPLDGHALKLVVNREQLIKAIDRITLLPDEGISSTVRLKFENDVLTLMSSSTEIGKVKEELNVISSEGDFIKIAFSSKYVLEALRAFDDEQVLIYFTGEVKPFIIKSEKEATHIQLILPVRVDF